MKPKDLFGRYVFLFEQHSHCSISGQIIIITVSCNLLFQFWTCKITCQKIKSRLKKIIVSLNKYMTCLFFVCPLALLDWLLRVFLITVSWWFGWILQPPLNMLNCLLQVGDAFPPQWMGSLCPELQHNQGIVLGRDLANQSHSCYNRPKKKRIIVSNLLHMCCQSINPQFLAMLAWG